VIQSPVTLPVFECLGFDGVSIPASDHLAFAQLGYPQIFGMDVNVAHDLYVRNRFQLLVGDFKERTGEIPGDPFVTPGFLQTVEKERLIKPVSAGGIPSDHRY
jgi:hypothetical protein